MISVGIDTGSATTKAVMVIAGQIISHNISPTAFDFLSALETAYKYVLAHAGVNEENVDFMYATGYGRNSIKFADRAISEITAHAKGVYHLYPDVNGIIDIGGQDSKVISVNGGKVTDFLINDKCAAGTGKFLEYTTRALEVLIEELGSLALASKTHATISVLFLQNPRLYLFVREDFRKKISQLYSLKVSPEELLSWLRS